MITDKFIAPVLFKFTDEGEWMKLKSDELPQLTKTK